jgi:hypothetical protein
LFQSALELLRVGKLLELFTQRIEPIQAHACLVLIKRVSVAVREDFVEGLIVQINTLKRLFIVQLDIHCQARFGFGHNRCFIHVGLIVRNEKATRRLMQFVRTEQDHTVAKYERVI